MTLKEAIEIFDANIPHPSNKMVDSEHVNIAVAWQEIKKYLEKAGGNCGDTKE